MSVFASIDDVNYFKDVLRDVYKANEAPEKDWYVFSDAQKGTSTWSFGQCQWDVGGNPGAVTILESMKKIDQNGNPTQENEFSANDILKLSKELPMEKGDLQRFNDILSKHKAGVKLGTFVQSVLDIGRRWSKLAQSRGRS